MKEYYQIMGPNPVKCESKPLEDMPPEFIDSKSCSIVAVVNVDSSSTLEVFLSYNKLFLSTAWFFRN